jgi:predicted anti-sigma-YlaC factor YlaD
MNNCEHYETLVSTWLDGPLDRSEQVECLDHVVRCESCRGFYVDARALDGLVASVRTPAEAEQPSREIWKRIVWATTRERKKPSRRGLPLWALQAAAVLVLAVGLSVIVWNGGMAPAPEQAEVMLGQGPDMTEARFVELTREVLGANRRYHSAMYEIMEQVVRDTAVGRETAVEDMTETTEEGDDGESAEAAVRIPA